MKPWFKSTVLGLVVADVFAKSLSKPLLLRPISNLVLQWHKVAAPKTRPAKIDKHC
jgi:hypothetical protein